MCNDKRGMGAPPKPKPPTVKVILDFQEEQIFTADLEYFKLLILYYDVVLLGRCEIVDPSIQVCQDNICLLDSI